MTDKKDDKELSLSEKLAEASRKLGFERSAQMIEHGDKYLRDPAFREKIDKEQEAAKAADKKRTPKV